MLVGAVSFLGAARGMLFNNAGDVPTARCNRHHHALATIQRMSSGHRMLASIPASILKLTAAARGQAAIRSLVLLGTGPNDFREIVLPQLYPGRDF